MSFWLAVLNSEIKLPLLLDRVLCHESLSRCLNATQQFD
jgi:hypothetical protein